MNLIKTQYLLCILLALTSASCAAIEPAPESIRIQTEISMQTPLNAEAEEHWPERAREVLVNALSLTGIRYKYGGNSPETGFDCSGFVRYVYQQTANLSLPHSARSISQLGKSVQKNELKPGDLVFLNG